MSSNFRLILLFFLTDIFYLFFACIHTSTEIKIQFAQTLFLCLLSLSTNLFSSSFLFLFPLTSNVLFVTSPFQFRLIILYPSHEIKNRLRSKNVGCFSNISPADITTYKAQLPNHSIQDKRV